MTWEQVPREEALADGAIAVTTTDAIRRQETVRVVTIADWDRAAEKRAVHAAATALDARPTDVHEAAERVTDERERLDEEVRDLRQQVVSARLSELEDATVTRDGREWLAGTVPSTDANALAEFAQRLLGAADVVALVGEEGNYLAVATDGDTDASAVVENVTDAFGGGGPTTAQAGGLDADPEGVVAFLRE